jgi:retron-type reverse transcriptase
VVTILNQIYEEDFRGFSYGFRPRRSQHQALDALYVAITRKKVSFVLDADIRGFLDSYTQCSYGCSNRPGGGSTTLIRKPLR